MSESQGHGQGHQTAKIAPMPVSHSAAIELDSIGLVEEIETPNAAEGMRKIKAFGVADGGGRDIKWKREPHKTGTGATRVRTFHGKLSDQGMEYLDGAVNEWLNEHPEAEVKFVTSSVGVFEGKIREPALVLNLWY